MENQTENQAFSITEKEIIANLLAESSHLLTWSYRGISIKLRLYHTQLKLPLTSLKQHSCNSYAHSILVIDGWLLMSINHICIFNLDIVMFLASSIYSWHSLLSGKGCWDRPCIGGFRQALHRKGVKILTPITKL